MPSLIDPIVMLQFHFRIHSTSQAEEAEILLHPAKENLNNDILVKMINAFQIG